MGLQMSELLKSHSQIGKYPSLTNYWVLNDSRVKVRNCLQFCTHNEPTRLQCIFTLYFIVYFYSCSSVFDTLKFFKNSSMKWMIWVNFSTSYSGLHSRLDSTSAAFSYNFHLFFSSFFILLIFYSTIFTHFSFNWVNLTHNIGNTFCWLTFIGGISSLTSFESHFIFLFLLLWASVWVLSILAWSYRRVNIIFDLGETLRNYVICFVSWNPMSRPMYPDYSVNSALWPKNQEVCSSLHALNIRATWSQPVFPSSFPQSHVYSLSELSPKLSSMKKKFSVFPTYPNP